MDSITKKRLLYQAGRRGTREADKIASFLTSMFIKTHPTAKEIGNWETLLAQTDGQFLGWVYCPESLPVRYGGFRAIFGLWKHRF